MFPQVPQKWKRIRYGNCFFYFYRGGSPVSAEVESHSDTAVVGFLVSL